MKIAVTYIIKGTFFYSAQTMKESGYLHENSLLDLIKEPDNEVDNNAIQIWLHHPKALLGYIPRTIAKQWRLISQTEINQWQAQLLLIPNSDKLICAINIETKHLQTRSKILWIWRWCTQWLHPTLLKNRYNRAKTKFKNQRLKKESS